MLRVYDFIFEIYNDFENYEDFIVGSGRNSNLKEILEFIKKETSSSSILDYGAIPYRVNELMESSNDISRLNNLGWYAETTMNDGLIRTIKYERNNLK